MILVSIVIVSWNVKDLLINCIKPFYNYKEIEIIIVDNNSNDDTVKTIKDEFPNVKLISNKSNSGFSKANNQGFEICNGKYIYILNPDTLSSYDHLLKLVSILEKDEVVGGVSPLIYYSNGKIQKSCARKFPSLKSHLFLNVLKFNQLPFIGKRITRYLKYPYSYKVSESVDACSGAAFLVRKELLLKLNGFNPIFIHTGEDVDLMYRIKENGYLNYLCVESSLVHYAGQSSKQAIARVQVNTYISTGYYFRINKGLFQFYLYKFIVLFIDIPLQGIVLLFKRNKNIRKEGIKDYFIILKSIMRWEILK